MLKRFDSGFGLEVNPRICVTGTFTLDNDRESPHYRRRGDGFETQYRQSLVSLAHAGHETKTRQDSAACVSLPSIQLSKSAGIEHPL